MNRNVPLLFLTAVCALVYGAEIRSTRVQDNTGRMHRVNINPFSVVDSELERAFNPESEIIFRLYTRSNPTEAQIVHFQDIDTIRNSSFNRKHPTRFTIHGWASNGASEIHTLIRNSYLTLGEFNVISVDWGAGAQTINYITARNRISAVAEVTSQMIDALKNVTNVSLEEINVVGHSLGAHIAGNIGKYQKGLLGAVFGLDPAGPLFAEGDEDVLRPSDAQYVEVVYSNTGMNAYARPLGDGNFYANGGAFQPGCSIDWLGICSHSRSYVYFAESILSGNDFVAMRCGSYEEIKNKKCVPDGPSAPMGGEPSNRDRAVSGVYWFDTNSQAPFAMG